MRLWICDGRNRRTKKWALEFAPGCWHDEKDSCDCVCHYKGKTKKDMIKKLEYKKTYARKRRTLE